MKTGQDCPAPKSEPRCNPPGQGMRAGLVRHTRHQMDIGTPGKDSYELRKAGALQTMVAGNQRWALMTETPQQQEPDLHWLASRMDTSRLDLILVEGFKHEAVAKLLLYRAAAGRPFSGLPDDGHTLAIVSDEPCPCGLPWLDIC
ncbi:molybdopterin-guanine dinucleotide biosynthesis protein B, partial [Affinibrenneria salicis]